MQTKLVYDMKTGSEITNEYSQISCFVNVSQILYLVKALIPEYYDNYLNFILTRFSCILKVDSKTNASVVIRRKTIDLL